MCPKRIDELLCGLEAGDLSARADRDLQAHLATCESCAAKARSTSQVWNFAATVRSEAAPRLRPSSKAQAWPKEVNRPRRIVFIGVPIAAIVGGSLLLIPRRTFAIEDVRDALRSVRSATWRETVTWVDYHGRVVSRSVRRHSFTATPPWHGQRTESVEYGGRSFASGQRTVETPAERQDYDPANGSLKIRRSAPPEAAMMSRMYYVSIAQLTQEPYGAKLAPDLWKTEKQATRIRFHQQFGPGRPGNYDVDVDPDTKLVTRTERRFPDAFGVVRGTVVTDDYRYNPSIDKSPFIFRPRTPPEVSRPMITREAWLFFSPEEKSQLVEVIARAEDLKSWDLNYAVKLHMGHNVGEFRRRVERSLPLLRQVLPVKVNHAEYRNYVSTIWSGFRSVPGNESDVLHVTVARGARTAEFDLRKVGADYRILHWNLIPPPPK